MQKFTHLKTGNPYLLISTALNCTNGEEGANTALYCAIDENGKLSPLLFSRGLAEFLEKFEVSLEPISQQQYQDWSKQVQEILCTSGS
jgi:hypothetical protein